MINCYEWYEVEGYSLQDIMVLEGLDKVNTLPYNSNLYTLQQLCNKVNCPFPTEGIDMSIVDELFSKVYARYFKDIFVTIKIKGNEPTHSEVQYLIAEKLSIFSAKVIRDYKYYSTILNAYKTQESKLLEDIKTATDSFSGFNDTPQNKNVDNKYTSDEYLTNYSKSHSESTSPISTPMARLREVQDSYSDVMDSWVLGFDDFFYEEENL